MCAPLAELNREADDEANGDDELDDDEAMWCGLPDADDDDEADEVDEVDEADDEAEWVDGFSDGEAELGGGGRNNEGENLEAAKTAAAAAWCW